MQGIQEHAYIKREGKRHVFLIDKHPLVCEGVRSILKDVKDIEIVGIAYAATGVLPALKAKEPDLVVMGLNVPDAFGLELLGIIRGNFPKLPVLVLSMFDEQLYALRVLKAGAQGFVAKHESLSRVLEAIRCVLDGHLFASAAVTAALLEKAANGNASQNAGGGECSVIEQNLDSLSDRELEAFRLIGNGLDTREIAERMSLSPKTVQTYRDRIKVKLGMSSNAELSRVAVLWCHRNC